MSDTKSMPLIIIQFYNDDNIKVESILIIIKFKVCDSKSSNQIETLYVGIIK